MSTRGLVVLAIGVILAIALVAWLGQEHGNEARAFLRNLAHLLR